MSPEAFFLRASPGQRFCLHHAPLAGVPSVPNVPIGLVVYVHPWAEEMNKSRRMAAVQARLLCQAGFAVLQIDLHGCGDSSDTWADASWQGWVDDVVLAVRWLQSRWPQAQAAPLWLWGLRAGCLLAREAAARLEAPCHFLFWQPAPNGKLLLQQFLRLKAAADLQGDAKLVLSAVREGLAAGFAQDIAGYALSPALAAGLEQAQLDPVAAGPGGRLLWFELSTRQDAELLPASLPKLQAWHAAAYATQAEVVTGPAFWQTQEIEDAPALLDATLRAMTTPAALPAPMAAPVSV